MDNRLLTEYDHPSLDGLADAILRGLPRDPERPCYSRFAFAQKLRFSLQREQLYAKCCEIRTPADGLLVAELDIAIRRAKLTRKQRSVLVDKVYGESMYSIARKLGVSRQAVCNIMGAALRRIMRSWRASPYRGLREVYLAEVNRGRR